MKKFIFVAISFAILAACTHEVEEAPVSFTQELTFTATQEGLSPETKTMRMEDGSTWWQPNEEISVFYGSGTAGGSKFTSQNSTLQEIVEFTGSIQMSGSGKDFWAVYPYSEDNSCDGSSITTVIPSVQTGSEGNFSGDAFPTMAKSKTNEFAFWNICGGIKFFVSRSDIKSVTFKGNGGETLAGKVRVAFNDEGKPDVVEVLDGKTEVTLTAPDGGTFKAGKYYYITLLPTALDGGFTMTFNAADKKGVFSSDKAQTVKRSIFGVLKNIDSKVSEWENTTVEPEWVDLGLSVKWATFNVGASRPEEYGDYYAWGETEPKDDYSWQTYKFRVSGDQPSNLTFNKYCPSNQASYWGGSGSPDNKTVLDLEDDAAHVIWGDNWRMPTNDEFTELRNNCTWTWTDDYKGTGVSGRIVTSNKSGYTDKSFFLPSAGYQYGTSFHFVSTWGGYLSSSLYTNDPYCPFIVYFYNEEFGWSYDYRSDGFSVRPVYDDRIHPSAVSLNKTSLSLFVGDTEQLYANVEPNNATDISVTWSSDNTDAVTVDAEGNVTAIATGTAIITITTNDGGLTASCVVTVSIPEPEYVDLGLSVKWATFNVGASRPEGYGDYFAWGEAEPDYFFMWSDYIWSYGSEDSLKKYNTDDSFGVVDNKTSLDKEDDAAISIWGGMWRMPTVAEFQELLDNCSRQWKTDYNGSYKGFLLTSKVAGYTDKSIFLPAAGYCNGKALYGVGRYGDFWSSTLEASMPAYAQTLHFDGLPPVSIYLGCSYRNMGKSIRPVYDDRTHPVSVSLNKTSLSLSVGDSEQLTTSILPADATDQTVIWSSDNTDVATVDADGNVTAIAAGTAIITVTTKDGGLTAACEVTVYPLLTEIGKTFEAVDLGLSVKWATFNLGSTQPEEFGDYYAWGEVETYYEEGYAQSSEAVWKKGKESGYIWSSYKFEMGTDNKGPFSKYVSSSAYGTVDNNTELDLEDDAACIVLGCYWHIPTDAEWTELRKNCTWTWTDNYKDSGIKGRIVTSNIAGYTDKSIFLPAAGRRVNTDLEDASIYGYYWSASLYEDYPNGAWDVYFASGGVGRGYAIGRYRGQSIRPVCPKD